MKVSNWKKKIKQILRLGPKYRKVFVICRKDLDPVYASVQGGHALTDLIFSGKIKEWNNDYLIYLQVNNEETLIDIMFKLDIDGIKYGKFIEPDLEYQITAIAIENNDKYFKDLELLEIPDPYLRNKYPYNL